MSDSSSARADAPLDPQGPSMSDFSTARQNMVDCQVRPSDVTDLRIVDAMLAVPREVFVPERQRALAYLDLDVEVSERRSARRLLMKPARRPENVHDSVMPGVNDRL